VAQSYAGWPYAPQGGPIKTEQDPFDPNPPPQMRRTLDAIRYLEQQVLGTADLDGIALRYGNLYGPGTSIALGGDIVETIRGRKLPIVADGAGTWSFIHVEDAAAATLAAIERGTAGVYNIVDDEPAPVSVWLPELAKAVGAKPSRRVPAWLARPLIGAPGISMMTSARGASNAKAKRELGWQLRYPSWRQGFRTGLDDSGGVPGAVKKANWRGLLVVMPRSRCDSSLGDHVLVGGRLVEQVSAKLGRRPDATKGSAAPRASRGWPGPANGEHQPSACSAATSTSLRGQARWPVASTSHRASRPPSRTARRASQPRPVRQRRGRPGSSPAQRYGLGHRRAAAAEALAEWRRGR